MLKEFFKNARDYVEDEYNISSSIGWIDRRD